MATKWRRSQKKTDFATKHHKLHTLFFENDVDFRFLHICHVETFENTPHVWLHLVDEDSHADEEQGEHPDSGEKPQEILVA